MIKRWKIERDAYYREALPILGSEEALMEAGFFEDTALKDEPLLDRVACTPLQKILKNLEKTPKRPVVLLSTGAFCPPHPGHLAMMEAAKACVEAAGFSVAGGFLSPGHSEYVEAKCGVAALSASYRLQCCARLVAGSSWLSVDPWEALCRVRGVNFTDVLVRLEYYLQAALGYKLPVFYVCGGDNARFALSFVARGHCVVVSRPGYQDRVARYRQEALLKERVFWAELSRMEASSKLRASAKEPDPVQLLLRVEGGEVAAALGLEERYSAFIKGLIDVLNPCYRSIRLQHPSAPVLPCPAISLDPLVPMEYNLAISRIFEPGGLELIGHGARPGSPELSQQLQSIPEGSFYLVDDDVVTGETLKAVRALLQGQQLLGVVGESEEEVLDARDFLLGSKDGGLVIQLKVGLGRAPYLLPFVELGSRASIPGKKVMEVSAAIWDLNRQFFQGSGRQIQQLPPSTQAVLVQSGFSKSLEVEELCRALKCRYSGTQQES